MAVNFGGVEPRGWFLYLGKRMHGIAKSWTSGLIFQSWSSV